MMTQKQDNRLQVVGSVYKAGDLQSFTQIFEICPVSIMADALGLQYGRFKRKIFSTKLLTVGELRMIARITGINIGGLFALIEADHEKELRRTSQNI